MEDMTLEELEGRLTAKQIKFVKEYEKDGNATEAARWKRTIGGKDSRSLLASIRPPPPPFLLFPY